METDFLLYGAGGHAKVIMNCLIENGYSAIALFDDNPAINSFYDLSVYHNYDREIYPDSYLIISIGNNTIRKRIASVILHRSGIVIHPRASISKMADIEGGTVVFQNAVIQPSVKIGKHCIINSSSVVEHDCSIADYVHVSPNATLCGGVSVGEGTHIGAASVILPELKIGSWATIGAGAVVIQDIPDFAVVVGNPAKIIKYNNI